ncbi:MAG: alpha/beta fold hydrolase [Fimbriimonadaceae bacterium]|nr:alpha/beta fold hydrolase [Fimbriimonadaceae bacterium]
MLLEMALSLVLGAPTPTAVMIHGAGGGGWEYIQWKPVFEKAGYRVVSPDLVPVKGGYAKTTFDDYVRQVETWSKDAKGPVVLIGASMGGPLALKAAETVKPAAVILINGVAPAGVGPARKPRSFPAIVEWEGGPRQDSADAMPDSTEEMIDYAWPRWRNESGAVMTSLSEGVPCKKPRCPVLVMIGEKDSDIPPAMSRAVAKWAKADARSYAGMSHVGPLLGRRGAEVAGDAVAWLKKKGVPAKSQ